MTTIRSRREALLAIGGAGIALLAHPARALAASSDRPWWSPSLPGPHPTPRPGITAEKFPTAEQLAPYPAAVVAFNLVREIPEIVDGVRCNCGCADLKGYYSLLSCYESAAAMAIHCEICQAQGKLVHRLHKAGRSLDEIRKGIDARFG